MISTAPPSLEDLVSSMSYLPRYRRLQHDSEAPTRRAPAAGLDFFFFVATPAAHSEAPTR